VSVIGFNDLPFMDKLTPALTTVRRPMADMGALAARALLDWIADPATRHTTQTLLPVELIVRGTTHTAARLPLHKPAQPRSPNTSRRVTRRCRGPRAI
jgi:DNA-binding LacI/PurR family transcriptional regulator